MDRVDVELFIHSCIYIHVILLSRLQLWRLKTQICSVRGLKKSEEWRSTAAKASFAAQKEIMI
jgi:hypothetical protein